MIDFAPDVPRWMQVADVIRQRIADGTYPPRTRVPSVIQLQAEFGIAQATAQKVLSRLRAEGVTYTVPGLGSFVAEPEEAGERPEKK
ncbi:GntR family transcriptional regulator [Streptomyces megasporus]|uniref:GntR family transcriptional regulator n=1 Tax=Streptomyces megasporus TaxID=44060 RepID=UPI000D133E78|nr:winged helix-turn-helix domain-containing protein [Streptomyces megasporus]